MVSSVVLWTYQDEVVQEWWDVFLGKRAFDYGSSKYRISRSTISTT